jgi:transposase-like protein
MDGGYVIASRKTVECKNKQCRHQTSLTAGTILHRSKQDLRTWFWASYLVSTLTPGISAVQFQEHLGLSRYETAFTMLHKLRSALVAPTREFLKGEVEIDECFIGGPEEGRPGRGAQTKALVICAVELVRWEDKKKKTNRVRTGRVRFRVVPDASALSLVPFIVESIDKNTVIYTDGWKGYNPLTKKGFHHKVVVQDAEAEPKYLPHVHRVISNAKTWLEGTHHGRVEKKHLQAYLNEYTFRFNRRFWRGPAIKRALRLIMNSSKAPTYDDLYQAGAEGGWLHPASHKAPSPESTG